MTDFNEDSEIPKAMPMEDVPDTADLPDFTDEEIAEEYGYPCALSNDPDYSPYRGRYFRLRMALPENKYELHMVLSGLKYFIKYRKLLPK